MNANIVYLAVFKKVKAISHFHKRFSISFQCYKNVIRCLKFGLILIGCDFFKQEENQKSR